MKNCIEGDNAFILNFIAMNSYYVYILLCADESYYIGVTKNLRRRFEEHSTDTNAKSYTANRQPVQLVYSEEFRYIDKAIQREKQLKRWTRAKKEALINRNKPLWTESTIVFFTTESLFITL